MVILEVILAVCGILCIAASFLLTEDEQKTSEQAKQPEKTVLSDGQKEEIRRQVNELVTEELNAINERTEASLDKISNTKILEMNDYADTVMGEINKSHNEAVFLYDMLNEKAKEVKNTVKDVNIAKHEVKKMQNDIAAEPVSSVQQAVPSQQEQTDNAAYTATVRDVAKERLSELVKQSNEKARISEEQGKSKNQAGKLKSIVSGEPEIDEIPENPQDGSPESIVYLYRKGMTVRDIAKQLGIGVGEVSLIIGLHEKKNRVQNEDGNEIKILFKRSRYWNSGNNTCFFYCQCSFISQ